MMEGQYTVSASMTAEDKKKGLSVGDLRLFLSEVEAHKISDDALVSASVGFRAQLREVTVNRI